MSTLLRVNGRSHQRFAMLDSTGLIISAVARVATPIGPIGQSELSMSSVCWARKPAGVLMSIWRPVPAAVAAGVGGGAKPEARAPTNAAAVNAATRCRTWRGLRLVAGSGNVQHNLEFQQRRAGRYGVGPVAGVSLDSRPGSPRLECLFGLPLRHHEVPVFALDRAEQLKAEEAGRVLDRVHRRSKPLLQFRARVSRHLDCVDLHHWHSVRLPCRPWRPICSPIAVDGVTRWSWCTASWAEEAPGRVSCRGCPDWVLSPPTTRPGTAVATSTTRTRSAPSA